MESISGAPARAMLVQAGLLPPANPPSGALILDNACGGGVVAWELHTAVGANFEGKNHDMKLICGDLEETMVQKTRDRVAAEGWPNTEAMVVDAQAPPFPDNHFTHVVMNMGLQVIPDNPLVIRETYRILRPGGILGTTTGSEPSWLPTMLASIPGFTIPPVLNPSTGPAASKPALEKLLRDAGFPAESITVTELVTEHVDEVPRFTKALRKMFGAALSSEDGDTWERYMKETYGEGEFRLTGKLLVTTAIKPMAP
ncbi:Methyltransf-25 domain-containing protein [Mycena chlorophos]|uniref:Methyltransf-25 domain-containing protein n=1 Tax=Mycena chlorophos TaxID=658473 RepID=A0A8H6TGS6_MYCCL|nr:Methyltransf-25 domain-containing protein [Mycena chlorophos]